MFKCPRCKKVTEPRVGQIKVVLETRKKVYTNTVRQEKSEKVFQTEGTEIVRELGVCPTCAKSQVA